MSRIHTRLAFGGFVTHKTHVHRRERVTVSRFQVTVTVWGKTGR
jgi:hypothetical protein